MIVDEFFRSTSISTRAPTRGATERGVWGAAHVGHFYSRPYTRGDAFALLDSPREQVFLLAPLREGRPEMSIMLPPKAPFLLPPLREGRQQFFTKL